MTVEEIKAQIEKYHQDHYWAIFPAGRVQDWVNDAILENIVTPLKDENEMLKKTKVK